MPVLALIIGLGFGGARVLASELPGAGVVAPPDAPPATLVVIGVTGLTWDDISAEATPALWQLAGGEVAAVGNLLVRSVRAGSCPAEGWLALNAGRRLGEVPATFASDLFGVPDDCLALVEPTGSRVAAWPVFQAANSGENLEALGSLAAWLDQTGLNGAAVGPGAAVALAGMDGRVAHYSAADEDPVALGQTVMSTIGGGADLVVVDAGGRVDGYGPSQLDERIAAVLSVTEGPVVVASLADFAKPAMAAVISRGLGPYGFSLIGSVSTRRPGLSQVTELQAALRAELLPAPVGPVSPWRFSPAGSDLDQVAGELRDQAAHATAMRSISGAGFVTVVGLAAFGLVAGLVAVARRQHRAFWEAAALWTACFPVAGLLANLVPWWRHSLPYFVWVGWSLGIALGLVVAVIGFRRLIWWKVMRSPVGAPGLIGLVTSGVLVADPLMDQRFTWAAPLGTPVLNAARLYGLGNPLVALFVVAVLVTAGLLAGSSWLRGRSVQA
ncbi:MAG: hypothetical protein FWG16_02475, partial [Micrococcales bacterium]|nr:hypothetical protein [Micrococcales bacterium]